MPALKLTTRHLLAISLAVAMALPTAANAESAAHGAAAPAEHGASTGHEEPAADGHGASAETPVPAEAAHDTHADAQVVDHADHATAGCDADVLARDVEVRKVNPIAAATMLPPPGCAWPVEEVEMHAEAEASGDAGGGHSAPAKSGGH
jgi:hypothetical protein